jgi:hypothetical protein
MGRPACQNDEANHRCNRAILDVARVAATERIIVDTR